MRIFAINPGTTSTKIALYDDSVELWRENILYTREQLSVFETPEDEKDLRYDDVISALKKRGIKTNDLDALVGRGGLLHPLSGGAWIVNEAMISDLSSARYGSHACNLGAIIALKIAKEAGNKPAYIVDPVCVDEMIPVARISGIPDSPRRAIFHALNQRAVAYRVAAKINKKMKDCKFIVAHMGGGVTVGAHYLGKIIDVNNALGGYGPMTPERAGTVHAMDLIEKCFSGEYTKAQMRKMIIGDAGLFAHLGTMDFKYIAEKRASGDEKFNLIVEALAYQVACEIGNRSIAMKGEIDAIILTGGLAYSEYLCNLIEERVSWLAKVIVSPGEDELKSLCEGTYRVLSGQEEAKVYEQE